MLGKLLKYELKASGRTFIPLYIAILVVALFNGIFMKTDIFRIQGIAIVILTSLFMALGVLTIVVTVQRFRKNLLGDEGYLMFTLPVNSSSLILSKCIAALIYGVLSVIIAGITFVVLMLFNSEGMQFSYIFDLLHYAFEGSSKYFIDIVIGLVMMIASYILFILLLYTSLSMGQLPKFNKHRNVVAFVSFIIINVIISTIQNVISDLLPQQHMAYQENMIYHLYNNYQFMFTMIWSILIIGILFSATKYILDKKLNLE